MVSYGDTMVGRGVSSSAGAELGRKTCPKHDNCHDAKANQSVARGMVCIGQ